MRTCTIICKYNCLQYQKCKWKDGNLWKSTLLHYLLICIIHTRGQFTFGKIKWNSWKISTHSFLIRSNQHEIFKVGNCAMRFCITKSHSTHKHWRLQLSSRIYFFLLMFGKYQIFIVKSMKRKILQSVFAELSVKKKEILYYAIHNYIYLSKAYFQDSAIVSEITSSYIEFYLFLIVLWSSFPISCIMTSI